jgi:TRAP-type C4-dicarboxylate transport system substrate-binding protein
MAKKSSLLLMSALLLTVLGFGLSSLTYAAAPASSIELKVVTVLPKTDPTYPPSFALLDRLNAELKGQVSFKYLGGPEAVIGNQQLESVRSGMVDMSFNMAGYSIGVIPEFIAITLGGMNPKQLRDTGYFDIINQACMDKGKVFYLAHMSDSFRFGLFWKPEIKDPKTGFKGLKFRSGGSWNPGLAKLGATPVNLESAEVYSALERGLVNGAGQAVVGVLGNPGTEKLIKYGHLIPVYGGGSEVIVNLAKWDSIPKTLQDKILSIVKEEEVKAVSYWSDLDAKAMAFMKNAGVQFTDWGAANNKYFEDAFSDGLWDNLQTKSPDTVAKLKAILAKQK